MVSAIKRRTAVVTLAVVMLVASLGLAAWAATSAGIPVGQSVVFSSSVSKNCTGVDGLVAIKVYTFDFGWFDSTGTTTMRFHRGGTWKYKSYQGEHDEVVRTWFTGVSYVNAAQAAVSNVWSGGAGTVSVYCYGT